VSFSDVFPAVVNDSLALERLRNACSLTGLNIFDIPEPMRWSEDFGWYGRHAGAAMAGIGAGGNWPQLHTPDYEFNDAVLPAALTLLSSLAENG
jgi:metal-dependent amidase/aminoacylase/carboxypeptidase family protein